MLDIDGDSCHHAHNACKQFYKQFNNEVEQLLRYIFTDFKWSADLREILEEMCLLLKVKYTMPENYVATRWLSVYSTATDTLCLIDVYTIFYFGLLSSD